MKTTNDEPMVQVGRIAIRSEGENVNFYYALPDTMEGALLLFSIRRTVIEIGVDIQQNPIFQKFQEAAREIVNGIIAGEVGLQPSWKEPTAAPEHERSGRA